MIQTNIKCRSHKTQTVEFVSNLWETPMDARFICKQCLVELLEKKKKIINYIPFQKVIEDQTAIFTTLIDDKSVNYYQNHYLPLLEVDLKNAFKVLEGIMTIIKTLETTAKAQIDRISLLKVQLQNFRESLDTDQFEYQNFMKQVQNLEKLEDIPDDQWKEADDAYRSYLNKAQQEFLPLQHLRQHITLIPKEKISNQIQSIIDQFYNKFKIVNSADSFDFLKIKSKYILPKKVSLEQTKILTALDEKQQKFLQETVFNKVYETLKFDSIQLLYKSDAAYANREDFLLNCKDKGPTIVFISNKENQIIGGYTPLKWETVGYQADLNYKTFVFSLTKCEIFLQKTNQTEKHNKAIRCEGEFPGGLWISFGKDDIELFLPNRGSGKKAHLSSYFPISFDDSPYPDSFIIPAYNHDPAIQYLLRTPNKQEEFSFEVYGFTMPQQK